MNSLIIKYFKCFKQTNINLFLLKIIFKDYNLWLIMHVINCRRYKILVPFFYSIIIDLIPYKVYEYNLATKIS